MDITMKSWLGFWWPWPNFQGHYGTKVSVYITVFTETNAWNATKFAWTSLGNDKEFIMFDDMHNIFKVTAGHD